MKNSLLVGCLVLITVAFWTVSHPLLITPRPSLPTASVGTLKAGPSYAYPDPVHTPGTVLTTDATVVCASGYSGRTRNVTKAAKQEVYALYGLTYPAPPGTYEADHFIPLELGGSNEVTNLWPESAAPTPGFHEKDVVENYLHAQVCSGQMFLPDAQQQITTDWYAVYLRITPIR